MTKRSKKYIDATLGPTYSFTKKHFYHHIMEINLAHVLMLKDQKIIDQEHASTILRATHKLYKEGYEKKYDSNFEDLFFMLEDDLSKVIGPELVGNMHIAFSRNDMDTTMFRMFWRERIVDWMKTINILRNELLRLVEEHKSTIMTAHTHNQQAQPTTLSHYLMAVVHNLQRDVQRGQELYNRVNRSPMGAAALSTTGYNIDRENISNRLGFDTPMSNSYDAISASDFMIELKSVLSISLSTLSRFVYDLIFMTTNEVNTLRLHDMHVQTSSIMPQKRNPSALEHTRASISKAIGSLENTIFLAHNVPLGDIVDIGDDIQPTLYKGYKTSIEVVEILTEILQHCNFNKEGLLENAQKGFATVTEISDVLVRNYSIPFRTAHGIVSTFVKDLVKEGLDLTNGSASKINNIAKNSFQILLNLTEEEYQSAICVRNFVNVRNILGGPSLRAIEFQYEESVKLLKNDNYWLNEKQKQFLDYKQRLTEDVVSCIKK